MQLFLFTAEYSSQLEPEYFSLLVNILPKNIQEKALRYRRWQDAHAYVIGKHLLRIGLKNMQFSGDLNRLQYTPENKPILPGGPYFNISHSGTRVVCLISRESRVGIDIEYINKDFSPDDFKAQFTPGEWSAIHSSPEPVKKFYQFWTAKESIVKADGRGLSVPLHLLDVNTTQTVQLDGIAWNFFPLSHFVGYACHVAVEDINLDEAVLDNTHPICIVEVNPTDVLA